MKSVGIDIGSSSIKVVEVSLNNKGQLKITQFVEHALGQNPAFDPEIQILEFLKEFSQTYDPNSVKFVLGLRQDQVSVRHKIFPFNDRLKIQKSLPFELEEDLPFASENAVFDAKVIKTLGSSAEVLACATPRNRVADFVNRFGDVGFEISVLSAEGLAFANCFENWFESPPAVSDRSASLEIDSPEAAVRNIRCVLSIGHSRTLVSAFENNRLVGVRSILWGVKMVAEAIARRYEIPYIEALKEMQTKAFILPTKEGASYDQIVFSDTIAEQFKVLCRDLNISLLELKAELGANIENVGLTGGGSQILNLQAFMTMMLELPCNQIQVLENFSSTAFEKTTRTDSLIGVALGLAIEGLKKPRNPAIQFLRGEFAVQNNLMKQFWKTWGVSIQFALAFYVAFIVYSSLRENFAQSLTDRTQDNLKEQAKTVAHLGKKQTNEAGVKKYIREQKKRASDLKTLSSLAHMNSALDLLKKVNDAIPAKSNVVLNVQKWAVEEQRATIEGSVASAREVSVLRQALINVAIDGKVEAQNPTQGAPPGAVPFAFSFKVDRNVSKQ
jgi:general secretion pathway protein L